MNKANLINKIAYFSIYLLMVFTLCVFYYFPNIVSDKAVFGVVALLSLIYRYYNKKWSIYDYKYIIYPMLIYFIVVLLSFYMNSGFSSEIEILLICLIFLVAASFFKIDENILGWIVVISSIIMVYFIYSSYALGFRRLGGEINPIFFGIYAFVVSLLCFYLSSSVKSMVKKMVYALCGLVYVWAVILTQTRGVFIAYPLIILGIGMLIFIYSKSVMGLVLSLISVFLFIFIVAVNSNMNDRFSKAYEELIEVFDINEGQEGNYNTSSGFRILLWKFSVDVWKENVIFGVGNERFQNYKKEWVEMDRYPSILIEKIPTTHSHSQYFHELAQRGLIGFIAFITLLISPIIYALKDYKLFDKQCFKSSILIVAFNLSFMIFSLTEVALKHSEKIIVFSVIGFISIALHQKNKQKLGLS